MQQVQLYIEDQRIELFKDETISLTETIQNVKDIAKVFTDFTKTFSIPATKETNKLFKHYYNFDIVGGFDARRKRSGSIKLNGIDFKKGKIKLEGVDLKDNKPHTYRITFFGDLVLLKDLIGEDKLDSLPFLDNFTLEYSANQVKSLLTDGYNKTIDGETFSDVIVAPLISCSQRLYYDSHTHIQDDGNLHYESGTGHRHGVRFDDLKYAIKVYAIIRAIEEKYDIEFTKNGSDDFIENVNNTFSLWGSLYIWLHRKSGKYATSTTEGSGDFSRFIDNFEEKVVTTYTLNGHTWKFESTGDSIVNTGFSAEYNGPNGGGVFALTSFDVEPISGDASKVYSIRIFANGNIIGTKSNLSGNNIVTAITYSNATMTYEVVCDELITFQKFEATCTIHELFYSDLATGTVDVVSDFSLDGFQFYPTQQIPEMKVIDFITGLFKTFNLTAYVQDNGKIKLQTLDAFYANQSAESPYDITEFVDVNNSKVNVALPFSKVKFVFKESKSLLAAKFNQLNNAQYGQLEYNADSTFNFVGKEYKVEAPWEKMLYERLTDQSTQSTAIADTNIQIQYGLMQDENSQNYLGKPLLLFIDGHSTGNVAPISFVENSSTHSAVYWYHAPTHTIELGNTNYETLLFNAEIDPFTKNVMEESLFKNYYQNYIEDVFNEKRRITKVKAFLPLKILLKYTLADTFIIAGKQYKINSITTNLQTGESDMELLNVV
jgi:hypothetical protein